MFRTSPVGLLAALCLAWLALAPACTGGGHEVSDCDTRCDRTCREVYSTRGVCVDGRCDCVRAGDESESEVEGDGPPGE